MEPKKDGRAGNGGKRPGAGRKKSPKTEETSDAYRAWLASDEATFLKKMLAAEARRFHIRVEKIAAEFGVKVVEEVNFRVVFDEKDPEAARKRREFMESLRKRSAQAAK